MLFALPCVLGSVLGGFCVVKLDLRSSTDVAPEHQEEPPVNRDELIALFLLAVTAWLAVVGVVRFVMWLVP